MKLSSMPLPPHLPVASPQLHFWKPPWWRKAVQVMSVYASAIHFSATREFPLILSPKSTLSSRVRATPTTAKAAIPPALISVIASPTPSPRPPVSHSSSRATTSAKPTSNLPYHKQADYKTALDLCSPSDKIIVGYVVLRNLECGSLAGAFLFWECVPRTFR